jgi:hypothetical protein
MEAVVTQGSCSSGLDRGCGLAQAAGMRFSLVALVALSAPGCSGVAIGDPGEDSSTLQCALVSDGDAGIVDLDQPIEGLPRTPAQLVDDAQVELEGTLDPTSGPEVPVQLALKLDGPVRVLAFAQHDSANACRPVLLADATLDIDAGDTLRGVARGELFIRDVVQFRGIWTPLDAFETTLELPDFGGEIVYGPVLNAYLLREDGKWIGSVDVTAEVATEPCDETTQMCAGGPGGATSPPHRLGKFERLEPVP